MLLNPGDHICAMYADDDELARIAGDFLAEGLRKSERCWYLPASDDPDRLRAALAKHDVDISQAVEAGALNILSSSGTYEVRGGFDPVDTIAVFNDAIEQALLDGFAGFRAAANMSWALDFEDGPELLITYEALLRSTFATCRATGLCLYDRGRMPLDVIDGALATHPIVHANGGFAANGFYDPTVQSLRPADAGAVRAKLERIDAAPRQPGA